MRLPQRPVPWFGWGLLLSCGVLAAAVGPWLPAAAQQANYGVAGGVACAAAIARLRREPARRLTWALLAAGMGIGALCSATWSVCELAGVPVAGFSVVDVVYFFMYLSVAASAFVSAGRRGLMTGAAEAGSVVCTGLILVWFLLYSPLVNARQGWSDSDAVLAYPLLDLLLVAAGVRLLIAVGRLSTPYVLVLGGYCAVTVADVAYFVSVHHGAAWSGPDLSVAGWTLFYTMIGAATLHPGPRNPGRGHAVRGRSLGVLYAVLVVVNPAFTAWAWLHHLRGQRFGVLDVVLPLSASAFVAVLLVVRLAYAQHRTASLALHDQLTGLPNRAALEHELSRALTRPEPGSLLIVGVDEFRHVNDAFGHRVGDALLHLMAQRLVPVAGPDTLVTRLEGDEFALLSGDDATGTAALADELREVLREPYDAAGHRLHVTVSIGLRHLGDVPNTAEALGDADLALHAAKLAGKDRTMRYRTTMRDEQLRRLALTDQLRDALGAGEFTVHYQPIIRLRDEGFDAVEALVRWYPAGGDPIPPDMFIPAAEDSGLIVSIGEWILHQACRDAAVWHRQHGVAVTVNVSPRQLREPGFADVVRRALFGTGLPAAALILEITEGVLVKSGAADSGIAQLTELRADGVRVAVDDFGTGYSSLAYLRDLPIDILKIDRSFLPAEPDPEREAMVRTIVDLGRGLGLSIVAEGVETAWQADMLRRLGCDKGQGWHYGRPGPADRTAADLAQAGNRPVDAATSVVPGT